MRASWRSVAALDTQTARPAALHAGSADLEWKRAHLQCRRRAAEQQDAQAWVDKDWNFHLAVVHAAGNPLLAEMYESLCSVFRSNLLPQASGQGLGRHFEGHEQLLEAIEARDPEAAAARVGQNLDYCLRCLQGWIRPQNGQ